MGGCDESRPYQPIKVLRAFFLGSSRRRQLSLRRWPQTRIQLGACPLPILPIGLERCTQRAWCKAKGVSEHTRWDNWQPPRALANGRRRLGREQLRFGSRKTEASKYEIRWSFEQFLPATLNRVKPLRSGPSASSAIVAHISKKPGCHRADDSSSLCGQLWRRMGTADHTYKIRRRRE